MKHIIVEGPDCCGKSYLIRTILSQNKFKNYEVEHLSGVCPNTKDFHEDLLNYDRPMLFDRFFIGETIYPYIFNREPKMTKDEMIELCNKYKDKIVIIFIDADYDFIIKAHKIKGETFNYEETKQVKKDFYDRYKELKQIKGLQIFRFKNYKEDKPEFDKFIQTLVEEID